MSSLWMETRWSRTGLVLAGAVAAVLIGVAVSAGSGYGLYFAFGLAAIGLGIVALLAPIELLLLAGILGPLLADTWLVPTAWVYYPRFIPMGLLVGRAAFDWLLQGQKGIRLSAAFLVPNLAFMVLAIFSTLYSIAPTLTLQRALSLALVVIGFGIGLPYYFHNPDRMERALQWIAVLLAVIVIVSLLISLDDRRGLYDNASFLRLRGIFVNPNTNGLVAMLAFFPILWWTLTGSAARRLAGALALIAVLAVVVIAGSRATMLGLVVGALVVVWLLGRISGSGAAFVLFLLAGVVWFGMTNSEFGRILLFSGDFDRGFLWQRAIELGQRSPVWGIGFGAGDLVFTADVPYLISLGIFTAGSHNAYLRQFVDLGVVGVVLGLVSFGLILARALFSTARSHKDVIVAALAGGVVAGLVNGVFEDWVYGFGSGGTPILWFFVALLAMRLEMQFEPERALTTERLAAEGGA